MSGGFARALMETLKTTARLIRNDVECGKQNFPVAGRRKLREKLRANVRFSAMQN
jgi:hypothetical protein